MILNLHQCHRALTFLCIKILIFCSYSSAQVFEDTVKVSVSLGGGVDSGMSGERGPAGFGVGALKLSHELSPQWDVEVGYHGFVNGSGIVGHLPSVALQYQLNFLAWIPWLGLSAGTLVTQGELHFAMGPSLGVDWRWQNGGVMIVQGQYIYPDLWFAGIGFGYRFVLNDPFDE